MKKIVTLLFLSFVGNGIGQNNYSEIDAVVTSAINSYTTKSEELEFLKIVKNKFEKSGKINKEDFTKDNVGIAFVISKGEEKPMIVPAKFSYDNELVNISAVNAKEADMQDYVQKYLHTIETIGSTNLFRKMMLAAFEAEGKYAESKIEISVNEPLSLSFVRGNSDWMYIVSIDNQYNEDPNPRIIIYAFKISLSGEDIFNTGNSIEKIEVRRQKLVASKKKESNNFPLYHDVRTDEIRDGLKKIMQYEPYKSNKKLQEYSNGMDSKITRYTIKDHTDAFKYVLSLDIPKKFLDENFLAFYEEEVYNIKHLAAHALADYSLGNEKYEEALAFYKKSIFEFPYEESSGTAVIKDIERILLDMSQASYKAGHKNEAYGYLIGLIIDSQNKYELASKDLTDYLKLNKENLKNFKKDLDKALKTIQRGKDFSYNFKFREASVFFYPMLEQSVKEWEEGVHNSEFYKNLK